MEFRFKWLLALVLVFCATEFNHKQPAPATFSSQEVACLAKNIYYEARGEPFEGQLAVAHVTLNRLASPLFPDTICDIVTQKRQFSWVNDTRLMLDVADSYKLLAIEILSGKYSDPTKGALFFHAHWVKPFKRERVKRIGNHIFYR